MKKAVYISAIAVASILSAPAFAADVTMYEAPPAAAVAPMMVQYDWSGGYVGIHGGGGWTHMRTPVATYDLNGWLLGGHAGFNLQNGNFVYGAEGDIGYRWNRTTIVPGVVARNEWEGSIRARLGYAWDRTMLYGTGGVAFTHLRVSTPAGASSASYTGWTVGAGIEHAIQDNWTVRAEYRYTDFGSRTFPGPTPVRLRDHSVRVGVSYKF